MAQQAVTAREVTGVPRRQTRRRGEIHGLRGLAIALVVMYHRGPGARLRYWAYLPSVFGPEIRRHQSLHPVPGVSHDPVGMFRAEPARRALFG